MGQEEIGQLDKFISDVQNDIGLLVLKIGIIIPQQKELHNLVVQAWEDVRPRFAEISP